MLYGKGSGSTTLPCFVGDADPLLARAPGADLHMYGTLWLLTQGETRKTKRVRLFTEFISRRLAAYAPLDGFGAGPTSLEHPLGRRGQELHTWMLGTRFFRSMIGEDGGSDGVDQAYAQRAMDGFGAFILGRNMFGPVRGPWPDGSWKGWWGGDPPSRADLHPDPPRARFRSSHGGRHALHLRDRRDRGGA